MMAPEANPGPSIESLDHCDTEGPTHEPYHDLRAHVQRHCGMTGRPHIVTPEQLWFLLSEYRAGGVGPKLTLKMLGQHAGLKAATGEWVAEVSQQQLAYETEQSTRTVRNHIAQFVDAEIIHVYADPGTGNGRGGNTYVIDVNAIAATVAGARGNGFLLPPIVGQEETIGDIPNDVDTLLEREASLSGGQEATPLPLASTTAVGDLPTAPQIRSGRFVYPEAFELVWAAYPKRTGGNSKIAAYKAWRTTLAMDKSKFATRLTFLLAAVKAYADELDDLGKVGTEYVKMAETFFGPKEPWRTYARIAAENGITA